MTAAARIEADYLLETPQDPRRAAETIAGEQSSGTFVTVPGETPELRARAGARIEALEVLESGLGRRSLPSGTGEWGGASISRARLTLSWPLDNLGPSLPNLLSTVAGNLFELACVSGLRLMDLRLPDAFADAYPGPGFGIAGTRALAGVQGQPLIGTIIKPSVGFDAHATAALTRELCEAGIDFIKDDELQADGPACPFEDRVGAVMRVINDHAQRTGRKPMYAFNLTGEIDEMLRRRDLLLAHGATCMMVSVHSVGLAGFVALRRAGGLPIHAHRCGWGALSRHPALGWSYVAWQKIWRLAGADHMHVNGLANKFSEADDSVIASARECLTPMFDTKPCTVLPVFSSGQTARQAHGTWAALRSPDVLMTAGGGIMGHPDGPGAGVRALRQSWQAAMAGIPLEDHARRHPELGRALAAA